GLHGGGEELGGGIVRGGGDHQVDAGEAVVGEFLEGVLFPFEDEFAAGAASGGEKPERLRRKVPLFQELEDNSAHGASSADDSDGLKHVHLLARRTRSTHIGGGPPNQGEAGTCREIIA